MGRVNEQPEGISTHLEEVPSRALFTHCDGRASFTLCVRQYLPPSNSTFGMQGLSSPFMYVPLSTSQARVFGCDGRLPFCALKCAGVRATRRRESGKRDVVVLFHLGLFCFAFARHSESFVSPQNPGPSTDAVQIIPPHDFPGIGNLNRLTIEVDIHAILPLPFKRLGRSEPTCSN